MRGVGDFVELASDHHSTHGICHLEINAQFRESLSFSSSFVSPHNLSVCSALCAGPALCSQEPPGQVHVMTSHDLWAATRQCTGDSDPGHGGAQGCRVKAMGFWQVFTGFQIRYQLHNLV